MVKKSKTPTFLLELPLKVNSGQAGRLRAHLEAARCLYNALLGEALKRMQRMKADPRWQVAHAIPRSQKQERRSAFSRLREDYEFSENALHAFTKEANRTWIRDHIDSMIAQTLATRAYRAVNRVCLGKAKQVRFKSKGRGLDSVENKCNDMGLRFILQPSEKGEDRLTRFGQEYLQRLFASFGVTLTVLEPGAEKTPEQELTEDLLALIASFSGRLYWMCSHKQKDLLQCAQAVINNP